ncbi:neuromedin-K receptor-like [Physella acuta]|uniref:neuromedin-K receptor-like n=1 Tax=Physella acuta TaxID=109671 RepID=UPI0027DE0605|nr:neuromedin-K receptor-like [Physella acuta]
MVCVVMYFLPIAVMIAAYTVIAVRLFTRRAPGSLIANTSSSQDKAKRKVIKMLVAVLITFVINWTPQQFLLLFYGINWRTQVIPQYLPTIKYVAVYMAYFNSALNPILYGGFNENFRKGFIEAFRCLLIKRSNRIGVESGVPRWSIRKPTNIGEKSTIFPKTSNCSVPSPNISLKHIDHSTESHDTASRPASPGFQQTANLFVTNVKAPDMLVSSCHLLQHSTHEGQQPHSPHVQPHSPHVQPHSPHVQPHSQHVQPHSQHVQPHSPHVQPHSPHVQPHSPHLALPTSKLQIPQGKQDLTTASTESSVVQSQENSHHSSIETPIISANKKV